MVTLVVRLKKCGLQIGFNVRSAIRIFYAPSHQSILGWGRRALLTLALSVSALFVLCPSVNAGGEPGAFLQWGAGARSLGMGRAFLAVSDDASATYWNPAAMVQMDQKEIMGLQATLFQGTAFSFFSYVNPTRVGVWGINMTKLSAGGFEKVAVKTTPSSTPDNPDFTSVEKNRIVHRVAAGHHVCVRQTSHQQIGDGAGVEENHQHHRHVLAVVFGDRRVGVFQS
jgi:hypothetical protein